MASGLASSVIVLESSDDERVPTEEEVSEYAEFLGVDPQAEPHLMWIAREGVVAPVPAPWKACTENGDDVFYFNFETGDSVWDHPSDEKYRQLVEEHRSKKPEAGNVEDSSLVSEAVSPGGKKGDVSVSMDSSGIDLPMDDLPDLSAGRNLSKAAASEKPKTLPALDVEKENRLAAITNEISDDDAMSETSPKSAGTSPKASPTKVIDSNRGSAGIGISPARGLAVDTSLTSPDVGDRSMESGDASPAVSAQAAGARSGKPPGPKGLGSSAGSDGRGILERSGQSGKSSNLSEVSEDFPSDFERSEHSPTFAAVRAPSLGDSLEISGTMDDAGFAKSSAAAAAAAGASSGRLGKVQDQLASLTKALGKLKEIRGQQREYLHLLQGGG